MIDAIKTKKNLLQQLLKNGDISDEAFGREVDKLLEQLLFDPASVVEKSQDNDPNTITVNGFKVPKPMSEKPDIESTYHTADIYNKLLSNQYMWGDSDFDFLLLSRNICHTTKEAAIAHAKAMLGIDPWGDK